MINIENQLNKWKQKTKHTNNKQLYSNNRNIYTYVYAKWKYIKSMKP